MPAPPERLVERFLVGPWTLRAAPEWAAPRDLVVPCDRPGFPKSSGVHLDLREG